MKKSIIFSILLGLFLSGYNYSMAEQPKAQDYQVVKEGDKSEDIIVIYETSQVNIVKKDGKYGVFDKNSQQYFVKPILDNISTFVKNNDFEYRIIVGDMLGYMNLVTKDTFLSHFDDISIINNKYLRVKKEGKVGISDKKGKVIVPPEYQKVSVTQYDGKEYLIAKGNGKYNVFYNDGKLISERDFYEIDKSTYGASIVRDLQPALKEYRISSKKASEANYEAVTLDETDIEKLPVPTTKRPLRTAINPKKEEQKTAIVSTNIEETPQPEVDIQEMNVPAKVKKLAIRQEGYSNVLNDIPKVGDAIDVLTVDNKSLYITNKDGKLGLQTKKGKEIIPPQYDAFKIKTIEKISNKEIIAAVNEKSTKLYDVNGNVLAKRFHGKVDVYTSMRKYEYSQDGNKYIISFNDNKVGEINFLQNGGYEYVRTGFNMSNMNKANELFVTLLKSEK